MQNIGVKFSSHKLQMMNIQIASHFVVGIILYETFSDFQRELDLCRLKHEITLSHVSSISMDLIYRANEKY